MDLVVVADTQDPLRLGVALDKVVERVFPPGHYDLLVYTPAQWRDSKQVIGFVAYEADNWGVRLYDRAA